jgi:hypothetical protein
MECGAFHNVCVRCVWLIPLPEDRYNVEWKLMTMVTVRDETVTEDNGGALYRLRNRKHRELPTMGSVERASSQCGGGKEDRVGRTRNLPVVHPVGVKATGTFQGKRRDRI